MPLRDATAVGLVAAGGAAGALARWSVGTGAATGAFPVRTLLLNLTGAFLLGVLVARVPVRNARDEAVRLLLGTGVLGGFTPFSTYAVEVARRLPHHAGIAVAYAIVATAAGVLAANVGLAVGRATA